MFTYLFQDKEPGENGQSKEFDLDKLLKDPEAQKQDQEHNNPEWMQNFIETNSPPPKKPSNSRKKK